MTSIFPNAERVLTALLGLLFFTLNDVRMFNTLPRAPEAAAGQTHALWLHLMGAVEPVYVTTLDLALRWGLAGVTVALCAWAVAETFQPRKPQRP
jgi:hypothetical protein